MIEPNTERARRWAASRARDDFAISDWTLLEFASALGVKSRAKQIDRAAALEAQAALTALTEESITVVGVARSDFAVAARLVEKSGAALRGGDALHLAIASAGQFRLATLDRRMAMAAVEIDLKNELLLEPS